MEVAPLNIVEKIYLEENYKTIEAVKLADDLKRPVAFIQAEILVLQQQNFEQERATQEKKNAPEPAPAPSPPPPESPLLKAFSRRKEGGVVSMNAAAAALGDELDKSRGKKLKLI
jgi:hypothetical protein